MKYIVAGRQEGIGHAPPCSAAGPGVVQAFQFVFELHAFGRGEAESRKEHIKLAMPRLKPDISLQIRFAGIGVLIDKNISMLAINQHFLNPHRRRYGDFPYRLWVDDGDAARGGKPKPSIVGTETRGRESACARQRS